MHALRMAFLALCYLHALPGSNVHDSASYLPKDAMDL